MYSEMVDGAKAATMIQIKTQLHKPTTRILEQHVCETFLVWMENDDWTAINKTVRPNEAQAPIYNARPAFQYGGASSSDNTW